MRVLHLGKFFPPDRGGIETFLADLIAAQRAQGLEAMALVHGAPLADDPDWLRRVPVQATLLYAPIALGYRAALQRVLDEWRPDALHLHLPNNSVFWALSLDAARALPWVVHWHADVLASSDRRLLALAYRAYRPFEQAVLERARRIIVTSPDYLQASTPLQRWQDKCAVVPLGLAPAPAALAAETAAVCWAPGKLRLLSIGRLAHYKGFDTLIRAVAGLDDVQLLIVGSGECEAALHRLIAKLGAQDRIRLTGGLAEAAKHQLLASCDAFCLASSERTEAFGVVVMEAMQYARPCLVSELPGSGLPWLVRSSGAGRTVPVGDVAAWQAAIAGLRAAPEQAQAWGQAGATALHERFDIAVCARAIRRLYDEFHRPPPMPAQSVAVVMPARDEAATIGEVIRALQAQGQFDIIVVNDQSSDATAAVARAAGATVLSPVLALGAWGAMQTGIRHALLRGHQQVITIDADGQHEPACIAGLLAAARSHDVVIGAFPERGSAARRLAWRYFRAITGLQISDLTSGFRCYNRRACELLASAEATLLDYQDLGVLLLLRHAGMSFIEVPVTMYPRADGPSRIFASWGKVARYMLESSLLCFARWHPRHHFRR